MKPVLFVTGHAPPERVAPFALLAAREGVEFALFGGRSRHAAAAVESDLPFPHRQVAQREVHGLAASGRYRAVVCGSLGRVALPGAWRGARRARVPFILWTALWAHPRTPAGLAGYPLLRAVYRDADAVLTYGPHVSGYVRARGARNVHEAPQAVDNAYWRIRDPGESQAAFVALLVGRLVREKGVRPLLGAWRRSGLADEDGALVLVGEGAERAGAAAAGAVTPGALPPARLRNFYGACDVLVMPSIPTAAFREPWGLVANEAMNQALPIIASDAVGAAAGGLVRDGRNGLVVPAGDEVALAGALRRLHDDPATAARMGANGREDVAAYTFERWAAGVSAALASVGASAGC